MGQDAWGPERRRGPWRELVFQENKLGLQEQLRREHSDIVPESVPGGFHSPGLGGPALAGCPCGPESLLLRGRRLWEPPGGPTGHARSHTSAPGDALCEHGLCRWRTLPLASGPRSRDRCPPVRERRTSPRRVPLQTEPAKRSVRCSHHVGPSSSKPPGSRLLPF